MNKNDYWYNYFFGGMLETSHENKLNDLYVRDTWQYSMFLAKVKNDGYRVYRNSDGKHKVKLKDI